MKSLLFILFMVCCLPVTANGDGNVQYWLNKLDRSLEHKDKYEDAKKNRIAYLRRELANTDDPAKQYRLCYRLFEEYKAYRNDSAMTYAWKCMQFAERTGIEAVKVESRCAMAFCQISAGIMNEAFKTLSVIRPERLDLKQKRKYYEVCSKLWQENANYANGTPYCEKYKKKSIAYVDTLVMLTPKNTAEYWMNMCTLMMRTEQWEKSIEAFRNFQKYGNVDTHSKAMTYAVVAWAFTGLNLKDSAKVYFARSAIYDNVSSTREITALYLLAKLIYKDDYDRASRYIHLALNDITFYDSRQRKIDLGAILPVIEQDRYEAIRSQRNYFMLAAALFVVLLVVSLLSARFVRRKNAKILQAQNTIKENMDKLQEVNRQLTEANKIKNEYIYRHVVLRQLRTSVQTATHVHRARPQDCGPSVQRVALYAGPHRARHRARQHVCLVRLGIPELVPRFHRKIQPAVRGEIPHHTAKELSYVRNAHLRAYTSGN